MRSDVTVWLTSTELEGCLLLAVVHVDCDDFGTLLRLGALQDGQTDTADTEDGNVRVLWRDIEV